jgi:hypothetical protein
LQNALCIDFAVHEGVCTHMKLSAKY